MPLRWRLESVPLISRSHSQLRCPGQMYKQICEMRQNKIESLEQDKQTLQQMLQAIRFGQFFEFPASWSSTHHARQDCTQNRSNLELETSKIKEDLQQMQGRKLERMEIFSKMLKDRERLEDRGGGTGDLK